MKNVSIFVFLILSTCFVTEAGIIQNEPGSDSTEILRLENQWASGLVKRDFDLFNRILAEGFIYTENDMLYIRDSVLQYAAYGSDTVDAAYNEDMRVHMFGRTAIVTGWLTISGHNNAGKFNRRYRYTDTWQFIVDRWQLIAAQDYLAP